MSTDATYDPVTLAIAGLYTAARLHELGVETGPFSDAHAPRALARDGAARESAQPTHTDGRVAARATAEAEHPETGPTSSDGRPVTQRQGKPAPSTTGEMS